MLISELGRKDRPVGTIQFGGGVFLRGFYDVMVAKNNKVGISDENIFIVRSKTHEDPLAAQNYMYTHIARDQEHQDITLTASPAASTRRTTTRASCGSPTTRRLSG